MKAPKVVGERFLVPASTWPDYECREHGGAGWEVQVKERKGKFAKCRWVNAKDEQGKPWADERIEYKLLRRLDAEGEVPRAAAAEKRWRGGILADQPDKNELDELWDWNDEVAADQVERWAAAAMAGAPKKKVMGVKEALQLQGEEGTVNGRQHRYKLEVQKRTAPPDQNAFTLEL